MVLFVEPEIAIPVPDFGALLDREIVTIKRLTRDIVAGGKKASPYVNFYDSKNERAMRRVENAVRSQFPQLVQAYSSSNEKRIGNYIVLIVGDGDINISADKKLQARLFAEMKKLSETPASAPASASAPAARK